MGAKAELLGAYIVDVPLKTPVETAHGRFEHQRSVVARLALDDGTVGWGEMDPVPGFSTVGADAIAAAIAGGATGFAGLDLDDAPAWESRLCALAHGRAAVETAWLDARAKSRGVPFGAMLGTPKRERIELSGWIGWGAPERAAELALDWRNRGFGGVKVKIGSGTEIDIARIAAVREAIGDGPRIIVDAGEAYDADTTIALLRALGRHHIAACEQPVDRRDLAGLARVRAETGVPLILDESVGSVDELDRAVAAGAVDIVKLKLIKHSGPLAAVELGRAAAERGVGCTVGHGFALGLTTLAEGHIASVLANYCPLGEMVGPLKMRGDVADPAPDLGKGVLTLPGTPGLGAVANPAMLEEVAAA